MNKQEAICLRCGTVQVRTDLEEIGNFPYMILETPILCPKCRIQTRHVATKDIKVLKKQLADSIYRPLDIHIFHLIKE